jgi:hypothetical protein
LGSGAGYDIADFLLERFEATTDITYNIPTDYMLLESGDSLLLENEDILILDTMGSTSTGSIIVSIDYSEVRTSFLDSPFYCTPITIGWYIYH